MSEQTPRSLKLLASESWALYSFEEPIVKALLHGLKYGAMHETAAVLWNITERWLNSDYLKSVLGSGVLVPVPISAARRKERGYNQAELIAQQLSSWLELPMQTDLLVKKKGKSLVGKGVEERQAQAELLFTVSKAASVTADSIILMDDVYTTGSTVSVCRKLLAHTGKPVKALVVAYEP